MKILAVLALVWIAILVLGSVFDVLGTVIWVAVLWTIGTAIWSYLNKGTQRADDTD